MAVEGARFTIKTALVLILFVGLTFAWLSDRRRLVSRYRQEQEQREHAETGLGRLSTWYANPANETVTMFFQEMVASDARKARVCLIVTCQPQVSGEENDAEGETSAP